MHNMTNECYMNYIPWKKKLNKKEIINHINLLKSDEGLRIEIEELDGKRVKIYANKTGVEYVLGIVYDNGKEENIIFTSTNEICQKLNNLLEGKKIIDIISY
ncbi:MAG: hypothetical protein N3F64_04355 [Nitrososphaeria archaeon]|nr:hypothetical protein [Nitrososphaeria archaeon]